MKLALALKHKARSRVRIGLLAVAALALAPVAMLPAHAATSAGDGPVSVDAPYVKANHGQSGAMLASMLLFVAILLVAYLYAWGKGVFKWD